MSWNLGTLTSWNPLDLFRPVTGLLYRLSPFTVLFRPILRGLRRGSAASSLLGLWVQVPPVASSECCVLSSRGLSVWRIAIPEESYRVRGVRVWSWKPHKERPWPGLGSKRHQKKNVWFGLPSSSNDLFKSEYWIFKISVEFLHNL